MIIIPLLATFSVPQTIGTNPAQLLWILPLAVAGIVVYKTIKLPQISPAILLKETFILLAFLICLLLLITIALFAAATLLT